MSEQKMINAYAKIDSTIALSIFETVYSHSLSASYQQVSFA